MFKTIVLSD